MAGPNMLIILSDQHSPHVLGCAGDSIVRTPNLDRLAARGTTFTDTYCAAPLCVPSRMTFMTSQYPSDIEVWTNGDLLSSDVPTFAHSLSLSGYETVLCGRMHFVGPDQHHGFEKRLVGDVSGATASTPPGGKFEGIIPNETAGQTYMTMSAVGPGRSAYMAYDDDVTARACRFIEERETTDEERPFCMVVGYLLPHCPYICPKDLFDEYMEKVDVPQVPEDYEEGLHPAVRRWRKTRGVERITPEQARAARAAYYGLVTYMDQRIGEVLAQLESSSYAEDTVVVYLSDHGEMAGEHGMWWKDSFYEGAAGVPMIWSWPGHFREGARVEDVTSLLDVGPTCLDLAGTENLPGARGESLRRFMDPGFEASEEWKDVAFAETYTAKQRPARMIRSGDWKLNVYHGYEKPQLFNVKEDPGERNDLSDNPEAAQVRDALLERVHNGWSGERVEQAVARNGARRNIVNRWRREVDIEVSERWSIPPGSNVFPEA